MKQEDFKLYVEKAMVDSEMAAMRPVVEKELLHYEIFNALDVYSSTLGHLIQ